MTLIPLWGCDDSSTPSGDSSSGGSSAGASSLSGETASGETASGESTGGESNPCAEGQAFLNGDCIPMICEPSATVCQEGEPYQCDPTGTSILSTPPGSCRGRTCIEGNCRPIKHNVVILFDTSESMNSCVNDPNESYVDCCGGACPEPWPICERAENPLSRLGHSKRLFQRFFEDPNVQAAGRFALLTFPQTEIPFNNECYSSIYDFSNVITGDQGAHETDQAWFNANRSEVVRVPFATTWSEGSHVPEIQRWVDFTEELDTNPELRATGLTPLGRSMFYAGEYFRHSVIAEGRACSQDIDCGSQDYVCVDGACTDPVKHCRLNLLLVFTDGKESTHPLIDSFYNPVVQARRMKFGLSCMSDADCLGGASCDSGYCRRESTQLDTCVDDNECTNDAFCVEGRCTVPGFLWPTDQGRCNQAGNPCIVGNSSEECAGFLEQCEPIDPLFTDREQGANVLRAHNGDPISITTHVINVSDVVNESRLIASHGGGLHFQVDLSDTDTLLRVLNRIADYKRGGQCALEMSMGMGKN